MAARPKLRELDAALEVLGGEHVFFDLYLELGSVNKVADRLGVTRMLLHWWITATPEREKAYKDLREVLASQLLDDVADIAEEPPDINPIQGTVDAGWVSNQKLRIDTKKWLAGRYNRDYSDKPVNGEITPNAVNTLAELFETIKQARSQRLVGGQERVIEGEVIPAATPIASKPLVGG